MQSVMSIQTLSIYIFFAKQRGFKSVLGLSSKIALIFLSYH